MRRYLAIAAVLALAGLGLFLSYWGAIAYIGARAGLNSIRLSCHVLQTAEARRLITTEQRQLIIADFLGKSRSGKGTDELVGYLKSDCSKSLFADVMSKIKT